MSAPLTGVQIFRIVLVDYEAWGSDLDARGIKGPTRCIQLYRPGTGSFFIRSGPWADRGNEGGENTILRSEPRNILPAAIAFCLQGILWPALVPWAWMLLDGGGVKEYSFPISYYVDALEQRGFRLVDRQSTVLREQALLLFRKVD